MNLCPQFPSPRLRWAGVSVLGMLAGGLASAQIVITATDAPGLNVPDNSAVGIARQLGVTGLPESTYSVDVTLFLSAAESAAMFNGDIYVTLSHNSHVAVLLNRVGRREGASAGYADSGFAVTLSDAAPADVHNYRLTLNGSHLIPLSATASPAALQGAWQPDGRATDPGLVTGTSPRTAGLSVFNGDNPNGTWTLFVADLSPDGRARLDSWSLHISVVPEPLETGLAVATLLLVWTAARKWRPGAR